MQSELNISKALMDEVARLYHGKVSIEELSRYGLKVAKPKRINNNCGLFYKATLDNQIIGGISIQDDIPSVEPVGLIYVLPEHQNTDVYFALYETALKKLIEIVKQPNIVIFKWSAPAIKELHKMLSEQLKSRTLFLDDP